MPKTHLIVAMSKDIDEETAKYCKSDLKKIIKFLIRQTYTDNKKDESATWEWLKKMSFIEFLYECGMFERKTKYEDICAENAAISRYFNAISSGIKGSASVFIKREVKDIFFNGFNKEIMRLHRANHDLQMCIDPYSVVQYMNKYITKSESGMSELLRAIDEETHSLTQMEKLNADQTQFSPLKEKAMEKPTLI